MYLSLWPRANARRSQDGLGPLHSGTGHVGLYLLGDSRLMGFRHVATSLGVAVSGDTEDLWKGGDYARSLNSLALACVQEITSLHQKWAVTLSIQKFSRPGGGALSPGAAVAKRVECPEVAANPHWEALTPPSMFSCSGSWSMRHSFSDWRYSN